MSNFSESVLAAPSRFLLGGKSLLQLMVAFMTAPSSSGISNSMPSMKERPSQPRTTADFLKEAERLFLDAVSHDGLLAMSAGLKAQFLEGLASSKQSMLPSYSHQLPSGREKGQYLAIDMGGTTLRVALIALHGRDAAPGRHSEVVKINSFHVDSHAKSLVGMDFFAWLADRILETVSSTLSDMHKTGQPLGLSLAWSFPIEQTSLKGGRIHDMGKGLKASDGLQGQDLGDVIKRACKAKGLDVELEAILNDSAACLMSQSYAHLTTRFGLILGTGTNIGAFMPVSGMGRSKFGDRPASWFDEASQVIVNTELGLYGKDVLPLNRWDMHLKAGHAKPWFQPLEHMVSGMYLGEVCRFVLLEAIEQTGVFGGVVPKSLLTPYALGTDILSIVEGDGSPAFADTIRVFSERHPSETKPTEDDMKFLRSLAQLISRRSSAIIATSIYTLWDVRSEQMAAYAKTLEQGSEARRVAEAEATLPSTMVAFNGAVIEKYPGYLAMCQAYIDQLVEARCKGGPRRTVELVEAKESSLYGAAIALACVEAAACPPSEEPL